MFWDNLIVPRKASYNTSVNCWALVLFPSWFVFVANWNIHESRTITSSRS